jgi:hypothetical protein
MQQKKSNDKFNLLKVSLKPTLIAKQAKIQSVNATIMHLDDTKQVSQFVGTPSEE